MSLSRELLACCYLVERTTCSARSTGPVSGWTVTLSPGFTLRFFWAHLCRPTLPPGKEATGHPKHTWTRVAHITQRARQHGKIDDHMRWKRWGGNTPPVDPLDLWAGQVSRYKHWPTSLNSDSAGPMVTYNFWVFCRPLQRRCTQKIIISKIACGFDWMKVSRMGKSFTKRMICNSTKLNRLVLRKLVEN